MKKFFDIVKVNLNEDIEKYFRDVEIESVKKDEKNNTLNFYLISNDIIPYIFIKDAEKTVASQILNIDINKLNDGEIECPVKLNLKYNLSTSYTAKLIFDEIKVDLFKKFKDEDRILATIYDISKYEFATPDNLLITFDENPIESIKEIQDKIVGMLKDIFNNKFNRNINIDVKYEKISDKKYAPKFYSSEEERNVDREKNGANIANGSSDSNPSGVFTSDKENTEKYVKDVNTKATTKKNGKHYGINDDDTILYGKKQKGRYSPIDIGAIVTDTENINVTGTIYNYKISDTKNGKSIFNVYINDETGSICVKIWGNPEDKNAFINNYKIGNTISVFGKANNDSYEKDYVLQPSYIEKVGRKDVIEYGKVGSDDYYNIFITDREDDEKEKRVELHLHTKMSAQDGIGDIKAYIETARKFGMNAMAITDHGCVNAIADAYEYINSKEYKSKHDDNFKLIYGVEGYLVDDFESFYYDEKGAESFKKHNVQDRFVVYNIITTGYNRKNDSILKIEAKLIENFKIIDKFSSFVRYDKPLNFEVRDRTGIKEVEVRDAKTLDNVIRDFLEFSKDAIFVTFKKNSIWNLPDILTENNINEKINILDFSTLAKLILSDLKKDKLQNIAKELKVKEEGIADRKGDDKKKKLSNYEMLELSTCIFISLLEKIRNELEVSDISELSNKIGIDVNKEAEKYYNYMKRQQYYHIILLAKNDIGRVNLYKLVSDSHIYYMYGGKPRIPRSLLMKYRDGLVVGSACILGEFMNAIKEGKNDDELKEIANFYDYLEIQPTMNNSFLLSKESENFKTVQDLEDLNKKVIEIGEKIGKPVVATCDCHYVEREDKMYRTILTFSSGFKKSNLDKSGKLKEEVSESVESSNLEELYFRTTKEMLSEFSYLGVDKAYEVVVTNTNLISNMIENISPLRPDKCPPFIEGSDDELKKSCYDGLRKIYGNDVPNEIKGRLDKELEYIIDNGYSVMYIAAKKLIDFSKENGYPVGSRGSVGSSLAATLSGVSEVNPLPPHYICRECHHIEYNTEETKKYLNDTGFDMPEKKCPNCGAIMEKNGANIPFETFLGIPGDMAAQKEPDIDLNFCSVFQSNIHKETIRIFDKENTFKAGTVGTVAMKTAYGYVLKYKENNTNINITKTQVDFYKNKIVDCKKTTGQHPGGMVVVPKGEYIYTFTPIQIAADKDGNDITTHFDYHKIDKNLLKLDILGHDAPLILKKLFEYTGVDYNKVPFYENDVIKLFESTESLGITRADISGTRLGCLSIPEFGTDFAMNMCEEAKPKNVADLIRIAGLAHGTDVWQGNVQELIKNGDCTLQNAICCRDDIMLYLIEKGLDKGLAFNIMESVRKGKGLKPAWETEMRAHEVPEWYIGCCKKIKYMFPKAHAAAYVLAALRIAYYKIHYPLEYYAAYFSIREDGFDYNLMMQDKETIHFQIEKIRRMLNDKNSNENLIDDDEEANNDIDNGKKSDKIKNNEKEKKKSEKNLKDILACYRIVEEMKARGIEFCPIDIYTAKASDFIVVDGKIMPSFNSIPGIGEEVAKKCEEEKDKGEYTSIENFINRTKVSKTKVKEMRELGLLPGLKTSEENTLFDLLKGTSNK